MRIQGTTVASSIFCSLLLWSSLVNARGDEAALKERVLRSYPEALDALEAHFSRATGSAHRSQEFLIGTADHRKLEGQCTFASNRPYMAKMISDMEMKLMSKNQKIVSKSVWCYNKKYSFVLKKESDSSEYAIKSFENNMNGKSSLERQINDTLYSYLCSPFTIGNYPLRWVFSRTGFSLQRVSEVRRGDKTDLRIEFHLKRGNPAPRVDYSGWILVAPDEKWVLHAYEYWDSRDAFQGHVEYGEPQDGFPVPKRVVCTTTNPGETKPKTIEIYDFHDIQFIDVPDRDFTLAAFGFPELGESRRNRYASRTVLWFFGLALASLVVAILLKYASSRFKQA